jgi:hypothetical protein
VSSYLPAARRTGNPLVRALLALALLSCVEPGLAPNPDVTAVASESVLRIDCVATTSSRSVTCTREAPNGQALGDLIVGGQNFFVTLASSNVVYSGDVFSFDATVQNRLTQKLGTTDGTTLDTAGVRVFFDSPPVKTSGSGSIDFVDPAGGGSSVDGFAMFTASHQAYYQYNEILAPNQTSAPKNWRLHVPASVTSFAFSVYVSAPVQYPTGYIDVAPALTTVNVGSDRILSGNVRDVVGRAQESASSTWASSDPTIATVGANNGVVTGIAAGQVTITATSTTRTGTSVITVLAPTSARNNANIIIATSVGGSLAASQYPRVLVSDQFGNPFANGAVSVTYTTSSPCSISNGTVTNTDADGYAFLTSSMLTLPASPGSCIVRATTSSAVTGFPIDYDVVVGLASGFTWIGLNDTNFSSGVNWKDGLPPTANAPIFIPKNVPLQPVLASSLTVGATTLEAGATLGVTAGTFAVNGAFSAGAGTTITFGSGVNATFQGTATMSTLAMNDATVQFNAAATVTGNLTATGNSVLRHQNPARDLTVGGVLSASSGTTLNGLFNINVTGTTFPSYGNTAVSGYPLVTTIMGNMSAPSGVSTRMNNLVVSNASLSVNGNGTTLTVDGSLDVSGIAGQVLMNSGDPTLIVEHTATFRGAAQQGQGLTIGTLELHGDFIQQDRTTGSHGEFEPGDNFLVLFSGGQAQQQVSFDHPGTSAPTQSYFTNVLVTNQAGVVQATHVYVMGFGGMTIGGLPASAGSRAPWTTGPHTLFAVSPLKVRASGLLTVSSGGQLDLSSGGSCQAFNTNSFAQGGNLDIFGTVIGGTCTTDATLTGSIDAWFRAMQLASR